MTIKVLPLWDKSIPELREDGYKVISTVSKSIGWNHFLSPFVLGPCYLHNGYVSRNMENAWQYSKVYREHVNEYGGPTAKWWEWAITGWNNPKAVRYPMGKGKKPLYSYWIDENGLLMEQLNYIQARKRIYGPLYIKAVKKTFAWKELKKIYKRTKKIVLTDYDAYDHRKLGMTLTDVLNCETKKMGHAFVLAMMLRKDYALNQMELR